MTAFDPESLRQWVRQVLDIPNVPVSIRNEGHQFFLAVDMYDFAGAKDRLRRIQRLASEARVPIPHCEIPED